MKIEDFTETIAKIKGAADRLFFHVKGEPLLHPDLGKFIDIAGNAGFPVNITTNGTLLAEKAEELLNRANLDRINISLHSLPQYSVSEQTEIANRILDTAERLSASNRKINPRFLVSFRLWTRDETEDTTRIIRLMESWYHLEQDSLRSRLDKKNSCVLHDGVAIHTADTFAWPSIDGTDYGTDGFCYALRDQAGILVDGTVVPCCLDGNGTLSLGNIHTDDWETIMTSDRAESIYRSFTSRKITEPLCRRCGFRTRFNTSKKSSSDL